jgi:hypothetical protein
MAASSAHPPDVASVGRSRTVRRPSDAVLVVGVGLAFVGIVLVLLMVVNGGNRSTRPSLVPQETTATMRQAETWLTANLRPDQSVVIDAAAGRELTANGLMDRQIIEIPASGSLVNALVGWRGSAYVVSSPDLRDRVEELPDVRSALDSWTPVAAFGGGDDRVEVRRIESGPPAEVHERAVAAQALRLRAGGDLADNPRVTASSDALAALRAGAVDERILSVLATFSATHELHIAGFPTVEGEDGAGMPRRIVEVDRIDDQAVAIGGSGRSPFEAYLDAQRQAYRPAAVAVDPGPSGDAVIRVTYPPV